MIEIKIETKHNATKELEVSSIVQDLRLKYKDIPTFTDHIMIESGVIPHSHPVLTLNTRTNDPLVILKTFVHEQFHWYAAASPLYAVAITNLKLNYPEIKDANADPAKADTFYTHLIVCWNTRNYLKGILDPKDLEKVYAEATKANIWPLTEKFVAENFDKLQQDLLKFDLVYQQ